MASQKNIAATRVSWSRWMRALKALLLGDQRSTLRHGVSIWTRVSQVWYWSFRWPLTYALLREIRNLPFRILATHESGIDHLGVHMGQRRTLVLEGRIDHTGNRCRSADIQSLESLFPWVTLLDVEIFLLGRMVGEECRAHSDRLCTTEHAELLKTFFLQGERHHVWGSSAEARENVTKREITPISE